MSSPVIALSLALVLLTAGCAAMPPGLTGSVLPEPTATDRPALQPAVISPIAERGPAGRTQQDLLARPPTPTLSPAPAPTLSATPSLTASATAAPPPASPTPVPIPPLATASQPAFSEVARRTPAEVVAYLAGRLPGYSGSGPTLLLDFSPSDILETMDTVVLDTVRRQRGGAALQQVYHTIARAILATLREEYGERPVLLALDAGHGGKRGEFWDGGAEGSEAEHNRAVARAVLQLAATAEFGPVVPRPIYSDETGDDFELPPHLNKPIVNAMVMRQARASMLAAETTAWNAAHPAAPVAMHEVSIHFNAGAGGAMVLHQGSTVRPELAARSLSVGRRYLRRVVADLNATGLLAAPLGLWGGNGLHDDVMMYRPDYLSDADIQGITLRYSALQGGGYLPRYVETVLARSPLR